MRWCEQEEEGGRAGGIGDAQIGTGGSARGF
jgi:hypothetical protein